MSNPGTAPGPGWEPPRQYAPGPAPTHEDWNSLTQQVARLSRMGGTGLFNSVGSFPDSGDEAVPTAVKIGKPTEPMPPGTYDFPSRTKAKLLGSGGVVADSLKATSTDITIVNYSPNLFAPTDGTVFLLPGPIRDVWIAIHANC